MLPGRPPSPHDRARLREGLLWFGFLLVLAAAVITVAIPELSKEPEEGTPKPAVPASSTSTPKP